MNSPEKRIPLRLRRLLMALAGLVLVIVVANAIIPPPPPPMTFAWAPPEGGSEVVRYEVEIRVGGEDSDDIRTRTTDTNQVTFSVEWLTKYEVRVRGIDAAARRGPWSDWSEVKDRDHSEPDLP